MLKDDAIRPSVTEKPREMKLLLFPSYKLSTRLEIKIDKTRC